MIVRSGIIILTFCIACFLPAYGENAAAQRVTHTVSGRILQIDWVGSRLTIELSESSRNPRAQMVFMLPANVEFLRGTESIGLSDIDQDDDVEVEYYVNAQGENEAITIADTNLANQ
jgi:hypothetical protein